MLDSWLKKWYKKSYEDASVENPSAEVWENIASKLDENQSFWYAANVASKGNTEPVSPKVWEELNEYVETQALMVTQRRWGVIRKVGVTIPLLILPFVISDYLSSPTYVSGQNTIEVSAMLSDSELESIAQEDIILDQHVSSEVYGNELVAQNDVSEFTPPSAEPAVNQETYELLNNEPIRAEVTQLGSVVAVESPSVQSLKNTHVSEEELLTERSNLAQTEADLNVNFIQEGDVSSLPIQALYITNEGAREPAEGYFNDVNSIPSNGLWRFGVGVNNQFSNLLNPITLQGLDKYSHIDLSLSSNLSFDFSVERKVGRLGYLGVTARLNDQKTQRYQDFIGSQYLEKQLSLHYNSLFVNYSHALFAKRLNKKIGLELKTGVYVSHLGGTSEQWDNQDRDMLSSGFRSVDVGAMIGLNGSYRINNRFDINLGTYYSNGVVNVFKGTDVMPSYFFRTFTSSFGGSVGVRYYLGS